MLHRKHLLISLSAAAAALVVGAGCLVGPDYKRPETPVAPHWSGPTSQPTTTQPTTMASITTNAPPTDIAHWWRQLNDPVLDDLVDRATQANLDVRSAEARVREARARRGVVSAGFWPTVNTSASYRREGSDKAVTGSVTPGGTVSVSSQGARDLYQAGLDASWELDVFGGVRRDIEAANADIRFAVEDYRDVLVTLTSEVALNYVDLRGFQKQLEIARQNLKSQAYSADLTRRRQRGGLVSSLDVANAEAQVASTRAQIPIIEQNARQTIYNISILLGQEPETLITELSSPAPIPATPPIVSTGIPSDLLRRRPDIRRAEANAHAATARIGVATADLFPRFNLVGSLSVSGDQPKALANWNNAFWSFGPSVSWPLFSAGQIRSNIEVQRALQEQSLLAYRSTILTALRDVESALEAYEREQEHRQALVEAVAANRQAVDLATRLYTQGQTDFLNVLSAQRSLFASEDALVQSDRTVATNLVALFKALGGGWEAPRETQQ
jgi:NodT family efflux transporter outer membrane factor (OMF) lipoprotein